MAIAQAMRTAVKFPYAFFQTASIGDYAERMSGQFCTNCGAARQLGFACSYCNAAYEMVERSDSGFSLGQQVTGGKSTAAIEELERSSAWLEAPESEDPELFDLAAMEIDSAIDRGLLDAAVKAHQEACGCDLATSKRIVNARAVARKHAWQAR